MVSSSFTCPKLFAYLLWELILGDSSGITGYDYLFAKLVIASAIGLLVAHPLKRKLNSGSAKKIANAIALVAVNLALEGQEKTLNKQIDEHKIKGAQ